MRIVLINQFYPPDVAPTGLYLHDLAGALVARGHQVVVVASRHAYGGGGEFAAHEWLDGVEVLRLSGFAFGRGSYAGKLTDYAVYYARLAIELARMRKFDLVVSLTTPPYVGLLAKLIANLSGARHAHWVMDVYPDVLRANGMSDALPYAGLRALAKHSFAGAHAVVGLGPAMAARLSAYTDSGTSVDWVPLWSPDGLLPWPDNAAVPLRAERGWPPERLTLLYSGNFGLGHRFDEFLEAARQLGASRPRWVFAGSGRSRPLVERFAADHPNLPIELQPYVPESQLREHLCSADVHLVSMDARWEGCLLPSKLQASFAVGKPVIFVGGQTQDMGRWITESGGGWTVDEGDVQGLLRAIAEADNPAELKRRGQQAQRYAREHFNKSRNIDKLVALFGAA